MKRALVMLLFAALGGCAHRIAAPTPGCAFTTYALRVDSTAARGDVQDFEGVLRASMSAPGPLAPGMVGTPPPSVLILSGGSQNGAFGAGFFAGMPRVPEYKLVTAISTGALQSTFLFLANVPAATDRVYPAYFRDDPAVPRSNVGDVVRAYSIERESDLIKVGGFGQIGGVVRGSIGSFGPLRATLNGLLSPQTIRAVGSAYRADAREGRRLLVGVADVNDGQGYAIDLTELASRYASGTQDYASVRDCYVDALVASSSVPLAASPVTLETRVAPGSSATVRHLYIDGGARFGVFWSQLGDILQGTLSPEVTLIVNGSLQTKPWLDKAGKPRADWSALTLASRSVDILSNQVYRFSVENVTRIASGTGSVKMAFISTQGLPAGSVEPGDFTYDGRTCRDWNAIDDLTKPTEFHPRYMRCLIEYGRARGQAQAWNRAN